MILWGSAWPCAKALSGHLSAESLAFWRLALSTIALIPLMLYENRLHITTKTVSYTLIGALTMAFYLESYFMGLERGSAHLAGVLFTSVNPLIVFILSFYLFGNVISKRTMGGLFLGILGTMITLDVTQAGWEGFVKSGNAFFIISSLFWALTTIVSQKSASHLTPVAFSVLTSALATILFIPLAGIKPIMAAFDQSSLFWAELLFLSLVTSAFASTIYFYAVRHIGSAQASSFIFIVPVSAILLSVLFLDEHLTSSTLLGGLLSLIAVYMINSRKIQKT